MSNQNGEARILRDQLKQVQSIHENRRRLDERAFYPPHEKRAETPEYKAIHNEMVVTKDLPCLICGVKKSTLNDKSKNLYGAKQMETHHHVIEWALANAIDVNKFNDILRPHLQYKHKDKPEYAKDFTEEDVKNWVDHSPDNLWVLCDVHHRAKYFGIHEITDPIWGPQDILRDDFENYVRDQIGHDLPKASSKPKRPSKNVGKGKKTSHTQAKKPSKGKPRKKSR